MRPIATYSMVHKRLCLLAQEPSCYLMGPGSPLEEALLGANADTAHMRRNLKPDSVPSIFSWILGGPTGKE